MGIAISLQEYLDEMAVPFDTLEHKPTPCASMTAEAAHVPGDCMAKAVVVKRKSGYLLAVVPASRYVELERLGAWLKQPVSLATEDEIAELFSDCETGAIPPIGTPYGLKTVVDESLEDKEDIYFEGGDHRTLVHISGPLFHWMMERVPHGNFAA